MSDDVTAGDEHPVITGIKVRLEAEREARNQAERDVREANARYARAAENAKKLEQLLELFRVYAANGEFDKIPF